jgi:hypothetical protein
MSIPVSDSVRYSIRQAQTLELAVLKIICPQSGTSLYNLLNKVQFPISLGSAPVKKGFLSSARFSVRTNKRRSQIS